MGRSRKTGKRVNGRLSQAKDEVESRRFEESPMQVALQARRRQNKTFTEPDSPEDWREANARLVTKPEAKALQAKGGETGRMKSLTPEEREAGERMAERRIRYMATNGIPRPTAQGAAYGAVRGGSRPENARLARICAEEAGIDETVLKRCGAGVWTMVHRACVELLPANERMVKEGLAALLKENR